MTGTVGEESCDARGISVAGVGDGSREFAKVNK